MPNKEITVRQRMEAAAKLSETIDKKVRLLSRHGDATADAFDETMAYAGIAHALATWWQHMSEDQVNDRLLNLVRSIKAARANRASEQQNASASVQPKEGATIQ
jgi:hypothetical protein